MKKISVVLYIVMTALSLTSKLTFAQGLWQVGDFYSHTDVPRHGSYAQVRTNVNGQFGGNFSAIAAIDASKMVAINNRFDDEQLSNIKRLKEILPLSSWSYLFPKSIITYQQFITLAAKRPQFCGSVANDKENGSVNQVVDYLAVANQSCRVQLAKVFAQLSTMTSPNDVSLEVEPWRQGLMVAGKALCKEGERKSKSEGASESERTRTCQSSQVILSSQAIQKALPDVVEKALIGADDELDEGRIESSIRRFDLFAGFLQVPTQVVDYSF